MADALLLSDFESLWAEAEAIWTRRQNDPSFGAYVSSDYAEVFQVLGQLRGKVNTVLEWGSGLGVVAIMASRMGFDAYGIEAEPELVAHARQLAEAFSADAQFAEGSFIPDEFEWSRGAGDKSIATSIDMADGYDQLDMQLSDFDLIYGYPWPDERFMFHNIIRQFGSPAAILLSYDARQGTELVRFGDRERA